MFEAEDLIIKNRENCVIQINNCMSMTLSSILRNPSKIKQRRKKEEADGYLISSNTNINQSPA